MGGWVGRGSDKVAGYAAGLPNWIFVSSFVLCAFWNSLHAGSP